MPPQMSPSHPPTCSVIGTQKQARVLNQQRGVKILRESIERIDGNHGQYIPNVFGVFGRNILAKRFPQMMVPNNSWNPKRKSVGDGPMVSIMHGSTLKMSLPATVILGRMEILPAIAIVLDDTPLPYGSDSPTLVQHIFWKVTMVHHSLKCPLCCCSAVIKLANI